MKKIIYIILVAVNFIACFDEAKLSELSVVDKNTVITNQTDLDVWIYKNFTKPYGIEVKYRWDKNTAEQGSFNYPPEQSKVKSVLEGVKFLLLETYTLPNVGGINFMKAKNPIRIKMYGGANIDSRGVPLISSPNSTGIVMGVYNVNDFDEKSEAKVYALARSLHHQFAKRLMSLIPYDRDTFYEISKKRYLSSTKEIADLRLSQDRLFKVTDYVNRRSFFSQHSRLSAPDDFAEIISTTLTNSQTIMNQALVNAKTPRNDPDPEVQQIYNERSKKAYSEITKKQKIVTDYFDENVGINLKRMQIVSVQRVKAFLNK